MKKLLLAHLNCRQLNQGVGSFRMPPRMGMTIPPSPGIQNADDGNLVATLEFRTAEAILPCLEGQNATLNHMKAYLVEKFHDVREGENAIEIVLNSLFNQVLHDAASHTVRLGRLRH